MFQFVDFYALLEVDSDSTSDEINAAFDKEAKSWHPGRYPEHNGRKMMKDIIEARRVLLDPVLRASYDIEYNRLKAKRKLPDSIRKDQTEFDIQVLLNEIEINNGGCKLQKSVYGNTVIVNPKSNISDAQLLHIIHYAYSYKEDFIDFATEELLNRNYSQEFINDTISKSSHSESNLKKEKMSINKWGVDIIAKLINKIK
jgi:curved DNA-binding protein CbpA